MPNPATRLALNAPGRWYVDDICINCRLCSAEASENFREDDAGVANFVHRQPASDSEEAACQDVMERCPTNSIGNDG